MFLPLKKIHIGICAAIAIGILSGHVAVSQAQVSLEQLPEKTVFNDFVVGPGKIDVEMSPGETRTFELTVSNRLGTEKTFTVSEEDFQGSNNPNQPIVLLGDDHGPYSLRDYLHPATTSIDIPHADKARITVTVKVPLDAQPGGLYGSVIVGTATKPGTTQATSGAVGSSPIITRIGTLFFIRVKGPVSLDGKLTKFSIAGDKTVLYDSGSVVFDLLFKNNSNVHLDPSGTLSVTNLLGSTVGMVDIEPWFAMPNSLRFREVQWAPPFMFGRYVAHASINRGYNNITDQADVVFWVIPWKILIIVLIALIVIIGGFRWIFTRFSIVSKKK